MKLTKVIFANNKKLLNNITEIMTLEEIKNDENFKVYRWERKMFKDEEDLFLVMFNCFETALSYIQDNYGVFKIIIAWEANNLWNIDLKVWDVTIPNTFIKKWKNPIFSEYVVWENYDLKKFWLSLSWVCNTWEDCREEDFVADVKDEDSYEFLEILQKEKLLDKTVVLKEIVIKNKENSLKNIISVIDLVL